MDTYHSDGLNLSDNDSGLSATAAGLGAVRSIEVGIWCVGGIGTGAGALVGIFDRLRDYNGAAARSRSRSRSRLRLRAGRRDGRGGACFSTDGRGGAGASFPAWRGLILWWVMRLRLNVGRVVVWVGQTTLMSRMLVAVVPHSRKGGGSKEQKGVRGAHGGGIMLIVVNDCGG